MAIHIVVDGYNLIGSEKGLRGNLQSQRSRLIEELRSYQERKNCLLTVVFDGWRAGWIYEMEERVGDLNVIFSRKGETADSVIRRLAQKMGSACVVVSSDREVRHAAEASGATAIYAREFRERLNGSVEVAAATHHPFHPSSRQKKGNARRLPKSERKRREKLKRL